MGEASWITEREGSLPAGVWDSLEDGGEGHLWDCTGQLMGCLEKASKVGKGGDKGGLVWKNKRIKG